MTQLDEIYEISRVECAEDDGQRFIWIFQVEGHRMN